MESNDPKIPRPALVPQGRQAEIASGLSELEKRIQELSARKAETAARIKSLEEKREREQRGEKEEDKKTDTVKTNQPVRENPVKQMAEALERDRKENPFKYFIIGNMHDTAFVCIYSKTKAAATLIDINSKAEQSGREVKFWNFPNISPVKHNTVFFSSNGFTLQLQNPNEVRDEKGNIDRKSPKARYRLVYPNWTQNIRDDGESDLEKGEILLRKNSSSILLLLLYTTQLPLRQIIA